MVARGSFSWRFPPFQVLDYLATSVILAHRKAVASRRQFFRPARLGNPVKDSPSHATKKALMEVCTFYQGRLLFWYRP